MATVAQLKVKLAEAQAEVERLSGLVETQYQETEAKTDSFLQKIVDNRFTALIVGGLVGSAISFYLVTC